MGARACCSTRGSARVADLVELHLRARGVLHYDRAPSKSDISLGASRAAPWSASERFGFILRFGFGISALAVSFGSLITLSRFAGTTYVRQITAAAYGSDAVRTVVVLALRRPNGRGPGAP